MIAFGIWRELVAGTSSRPDGWVTDVFGEPERYASQADAARTAAQYERRSDSGRNSYRYIVKEL